ncbi:complement C3-H1-like precursor [Silurus asotus]|uniref:Complement C3-H1-like n=1 Tax=Silurus asotus TaxID=30991 RepID=A0AAD5FPL3_SILAS|nr:complement C3-H1-like precursor [Silurus asotus]
MVSAVSIWPCGYALPAASRAPVLRGLRSFENGSSPGVFAVLRILPPRWNKFREIGGSMPGSCFFSRWGGPHVSLSEEDELVDAGEPADSSQPVLYMELLVVVARAGNVLLAPNLLRVGTDEKVFVEAQDYRGGDLPVRIRIKDYPQKTTEFTSATTTLTAANNFQSEVKIQIPTNKSFFSDDPLEKQYVYLQAQFPTSLLEKVVLVSFLSGFIFVQTDKSIYTPGTTGKINWIQQCK